MRSKRSTDEAPITLFSFQDIITSLSGIMILLVLMLALEVVSRRDRPAAAAAAAPAPSVRADRQAAVQALRAECARLARDLASLTATTAVATAPVDRLAAARLQVEQAQSVETLRATLMRQRTRLTQTRTHQAELQAEKTAREARLAALSGELTRRDAAAASRLAGQHVFFIPEPGLDKTPWLVECSGGGIRAGRLAQAEAPRGFPATAAGEKEFLEFARTRPAKTDAFVVLMKPSGVGLAMNLVAQIQGAGYDVGYDALEEEFDVGFGKAP